MERYWIGIWIEARDHEVVAGEVEPERIWVPFERSRGIRVSFGRISQLPATATMRVAVDPSEVRLCFYDDPVFVISHFFLRMVMVVFHLSDRAFRLTLDWWVSWFCFC